MGVVEAMVAVAVAVTAKAVVAATVVVVVESLETTVRMLPNNLSMSHGRPAPQQLLAHLHPKRHL